jgi:hypothetical protein
VLPVDRRSGRTHEQKSTSRDAFLSSWPGFLQAPLMGFPKNAPPSDWALVVYSCSESLGLTPLGLFASARLCQRTSPVPSSWFPTTLAVSSVESPAGLLRPAADHGVRHVTDSKRKVPKHPTKLLLPRRSTLRSLSTPVAVQRVSTVLLDPCPHAVHRPKTARLQGFTPRGGFTTSQRPCSHGRRTTSLGFFSIRPCTIWIQVAPPAPRRAKATQRCDPPANRRIGIQGFFQLGLSHDDQAPIHFSIEDVPVKGSSLVFPATRSALEAKSTPKESKGGGSCLPVVFLPHREGAVNGLDGDETRTGSGTRST